MDALSLEVNVIPCVIIFLNLPNSD